jgi:hypothetical protein
MKNESELLNERIIFLQEKQANDFGLLKKQLAIVHEELKPINLIKNTFHEVATSPDIKHNLFSHALGLATGYLSKKILLGTSEHPVKKIFGTILQFAVANVVSNHSDSIKSTSKKLIESALKPKEKQMQFLDN